MTTEIDIDAFVAYEAAGFCRVADAYNRHFSDLTGRIAEPLLDAAGVGVGSRVLDIATGPGQVAALAAERDASVIGLDLATEMVDLARRLHPAIEFRQGDAHQLTFPDRSFDAVVANFLMPHLADHAGAVAEMARVLVAGGRLALSTWDLPRRSPFPGVLFLAVEEAAAPLAEGIPPGPPFFRFADDDTFALLLSDAGLVDVAVTTVAFTHHIDSADAFWSSMLDGSVRASAQIRGQSPEMQAHVRTAFDRLLTPYTSNATLTLPVSVKVASARKA